MDIDSKTFAKIQRVLKFVWNNHNSFFYRNKYQKAGIKSYLDIKSSQDFFKLPMLKKEELINTSPWQRLYLPKEKIEVVGVTSGTTGNPYPTVLFNSRYHPIQIEQNLKKAIELKIRTYIFLLPPLAGQARLLRFAFLKKYGINRILGDIQNLFLTSKIMAQLTVDAIETTPSILYYFLPILKKEYDPLKIKYITLGGEYCSQQKAALLQKSFPNAYFRFIYGGVETGQNAYRCQYLEHLPVRFFHPLPIFYFETIDSKEEGEALLTHLTTSVAFPLIRYRTGDFIKLTTKSCRCGNNQLLEVFGKLEYEVSKVAGTMIYAQEVYKTITPFEKYLASSDFKLHLYEIRHNDKLQIKLILQLIPTDKVLDQDKLKSEIAKHVSQNLYLSASQTLSPLVEKEVFLPLEVEFVQSFPNEGKKKHIISHI